MPKYRKKPVEVEAVRFKGSSTQLHAIKKWMGGEDYIEPGIVTADMNNLIIDTLEGAMKAVPGDYIIKGVQGEFYPVKASIFEQTYEIVE